MNREIKFRAWDKSCNKMRGISGLQDCFSLRSDGICNEDYILLQYTGLHDKNGKEIYEGDILCEYRLDGTYRMFKIFRSKGGFVFNTNQDDFKKPINQILFTESCSDMQNAGFLETCEIEGNIWTYVW